MINSVRYLLAVLVLMMSFTAVCEDFDPLGAGIEENLRHPKVPNKAAAAVTSAMSQFVRTLRNQGLTVSAVREGQVVLVTIPAARLFAPNSTVLKEDAGAVLRTLMPYIKRPDNYKVIVAVHSDDTGDEQYNDTLTSERANAVDEFFFSLNNNQETGIIPYGLGYDEPVAPNNSIEGRSWNRRVEIYFVPTQEYIDKIRRRK